MMSDEAVWDLDLWPKAKMFFWARPIRQNLPICQVLGILQRIKWIHFLAEVTRFWIIPSPIWRPLAGLDINTVICGWSGLTMNPDFYFKNVGHLAYSSTEIYIRLWANHLGGWSFSKPNSTLCVWWSKRILTAKRSSQPVFTSASLGSWLGSTSSERMSSNVRALRFR